MASHMAELRAQQTAETLWLGVCETTGGPANWITEYTFKRNQQKVKDAAEHL